MRGTPFLALFGPVLCYSNAASTSLDELATEINAITTYVNTLKGCGYQTTTQAISERATVSEGSACPSADSSIASRLSSLGQAQQSTIEALKESRSSQAVTSSQILSHFNAYASAFYTLFNAMDLAECTYILTTKSQSFAAQFTEANNLKDGFNGIVTELSHDPVTALEIAGTDLKQQTHFGGTSFLATQVGGPKITALAGCDIITSIVKGEDGQQF